MKKLLVVIAIIFVAAVAQAQFEHPELKAGTKHVRTVAIVPVHAEVTKVGVKGGEPMIEESRDVEKRLAPVLASVLKQAGLKVVQDGFAPEALEKDAELRYAVDDVQKKFDEALRLIHRKSKDVRKGRYSLGDVVGKLNLAGDPDALVLTRASAEVLTGGKKAFGWIVGGQVFDMVQMDIGLVDARTGDVLYFAKPLMIKNLAKNTEETRDGIQKSFKNFAKANGIEEKAATAEGK